MKVMVRYFAAARELAGRDEELVDELDAASDVPALLRVIGRRHPALAPHLGRMRFAINGEIVARGEPLAEGDEVVLLPPVAGGSGPREALLVAVRDRPLSVEECTRAVTHRGAGGVSVFIGVVRDTAGGRTVVRLDYEAHPQMAVQEMRRIVEEVAGRTHGVRIAAVHRVGRLSVGDLALVVAASAPHRQDAFDACRATVDRIKETVPVWKKEWTDDGRGKWVNLEAEPEEPDP